MQPVFLRAKTTPITKTDEDAGGDNMIKEGYVFDWIPGPVDPHVSVMINGTERRSWILESYFRRPVTIGIGDFWIKLCNPNGQLSGLFSKGQEVIFYADHADGTTKKFQGVIDYPNENMGREGQVIEIEGRHRAYASAETLVCYAANNEECSAVIKAVVDEYLASYGFTYANVAATTTYLTKTWNYAPFTQFMKDICHESGCDYRIDNDLDVHFFEANSIMNEDEAVVEGQNSLGMTGFGTDTYFEKTRVIAMGMMSDGVTPIIHTAITPGEGAVKREVFIKDASADTETEVMNMALAELSQYENLPPQAKVKSYGLATLDEGENLWFSLPRNKIHGIYKALEVKDWFGSRIPTGWMTEITIEKETKGTDTAIADRARKENLIQNAPNPNKLDHSYNFEFNDTANIESQTNTTISGGFLKVTANTGTMVTMAKTAASDITKVELRYAGADLGATIFQVSCDNGNTWITVTRNAVTAIPAESRGRYFKMKVIFAKDANNNYPQIDLLAGLFS